MIYVKKTIRALYLFLVIIITLFIVSGCAEPNPILTANYKMHLAEDDRNTPLLPFRVNTGNAIADVAIGIVADAYRRSVVTNPENAGLYFTFFLTMIMIFTLSITFIILRESRMFIKWAKETFGKDKSIEVRMMDLMELMIWEKRLPADMKNRIRKELTKSLLE